MLICANWLARPGFHMPVLIFSGCCLMFTFSLLSHQTDQQGRVLTPHLEVCHCEAARLDGVRNCTGGRYLYLKPNIWAGKVEPDDNRGNEEIAPVLVEPGTVDSPFQNTSLFSSNVDYKFTVAPCDNGLCSAKDWLYGSGRACHLNGIGPLCGQCKAGTNLKLAVGVSCFQLFTNSLSLG